MEIFEKAIVYDRRESMPKPIEDEKDLKIKELEKMIKTLNAQIAHLKWVSGVQFL